MNSNELLTFSNHKIINGVKKILDNDKNDLVDEDINLSLYKANLKNTDMIKDKVKKISKIIKELKEFK